MTSTARGAAFSDVDETLIRVKSMFRFLEFYLRLRGEPPATYERLTGELRQAALEGAPRDEINRRYYRLLRGESASRLTAAGRRWFAAEWESQEQGLYLPEVEEALLAHRKAGRALILVSGSFFAPLEPIATDIGAEKVLATRPVIRRGDLTGEVLVPMIGRTKGRAVRLTAPVAGLDLAASWAYGDHSSDLSMLRAVGHPVAVGDDPELAAHANTPGWARLTAGLVRR
ncbi:HAD-IB family hydrolase [Streptomyces litmocidini]|uniref:HAD family hydrolase n=1 Tax=Streptomyces litmocidini TaxID=67318 RepID=A0ABW7U848_9ACTN|nr:HAD-IB family hydrolase [Streptomyces sp. PanSC19]ROQ34981.1 HAD superfamily hydrolase (TIGR01490 family) [Streptomyces sp. PanSC19]